MSIEQGLCGNMVCVTSSAVVNASKGVYEGFSKVKMVLLASFSALLYVVSCGMASSYTAPATVDMRAPGSRLKDVTSDQITWMASLHSMSSGLGTITAGYLTHTFGRHFVILCTSLPYVMGWLMITYASTVQLIYCGRLFQGFCYGCCAVAIPAYIVEIAPTHIRGLLSSGFQIAFVVGVIIMMSLGNVLRWTGLAATGAAVITVATCIIFLIPESPSWLLSKSRISEATEAMRFLYGKDANVEKEIESLVGSFHEEGIVWRDILEPEVYKPIFISVALMFFCQATGYVTTISYTVDIFMNIGSSFDPHTSAELLPWVQLVSTLFCSTLVEKVGRKSLFICSGALLVFFLVLLGTYAVLSDYGVDVLTVGWIPLFGLCGYTASFALGFGSIPLIMVSEMVPTKSRSLVLTISILFSSFCTFAVTKTYGIITQNIGYYGLFWIYGSFTLLGTIFGFFFLPETKGRSIADINKSFSRYQTESN